MSQVLAQSLVIQSPKFALVTEEFLTFHPQQQGDTLYVIKMLLGTNINAQIATIHSINFEIMHC